jgi:DNA-binding transcriptional ArsR family regulator
MSPRRSIPWSGKKSDLKKVDITTVLEALSDPVRLQMVRQLAECTGVDELSCGQLELPVTKSTGSHHIKTLSRAGIIASREDGTRKYLRLRRAVLSAKPTRRKN